jgi:putative ABC transport system permease protein
MTVRLHDGENVSAMESELQRAYPGYDVRTNQEQLQATIQRQAVVIAGGVSLVLLALVAGMALTLNVVLSLIQKQRETFAALKAVGCSSGTLAGVIAVQTVFVGLLGICGGVLATFPLAIGVDWVAVTVTGFENVVRTPRSVYLLGGGVAAVMSVVSALVSGGEIRRLDVQSVLRR